MLSSVSVANLQHAQDLIGCLRLGGGGGGGGGWGGGVEREQEGGGGGVKYGC